MLFSFFWFQGVSYNKGLVKKACSGLSRVEVTLWSRDNSSSKRHKFNALKDDDSGDRDQNEEKKCTEIWREEKNIKWVGIVARGRLLSLDRQNIPCSTTILPGTPWEPQALLPVRTAMNRVLNRLELWTLWSSFEGFYSHMICPKNLMATVTSASSKKKLNPCGRMMQIKMVTSGSFICGRTWLPIAGKISSWPC